MSREQVYESVVDVYIHFLKVQKKINFLVKNDISMAELGRLSALDASLQELIRSAVWQLEMDVVISPSDTRSVTKALQSQVDSARVYHVKSHFKGTDQNDNVFECTDQDDNVFERYKSWFLFFLDDRKKLTQDQCKRYRSLKKTYDKYIEDMNFTVLADDPDNDKCFEDIMLEVESQQAQAVKALKNWINPRDAKSTTPSIGKNRSVSSAGREVYCKVVNLYIDILKIKIDQGQAAVSIETMGELEALENALEQLIAFAIRELTLKDAESLSDTGISQLAGLISSGESYLQKFNSENFDQDDGVFECLKKWLLFYLEHSKNLPKQDYAEFMSVKGKCMLFLDKMQYAASGAPKSLAELGAKHIEVTIALNQQVGSIAKDASKNPQAGNGISFITNIFCSSKPTEKSRLEKSRPSTDTFTL
jgi:hypothetical protein